LAGEEADEFVRLYQQTAADLSTLRSLAPEPVLVARLSNVLSRSGGRSTGAREVNLGAVSRYFLISLPAAFYRVTWCTIAVMSAFCVVAAFYGAWVYHTPGGLDTLASPVQRADYANQAFESYYSNLSAPDFTQVVWVNNAFIAAQMVAFGVTG